MDADIEDLLAYRDGVYRRLHMWDSQIRLLEARLHYLGVSALHSSEGVRMLRRRWQVLNSTLETLRDTEEAVWLVVREDVERAFGDLEESLERLRTQNVSGRE